MTNVTHPHLGTHSKFQQLWASLVIDFKEMQSIGSGMVGEINIPEHSNRSSIIKSITHLFADISRSEQCLAYYNL